MRTMTDVKRCGSLRSMRHITSRPYEDKSVPHLTLYVQQMNKTKLLKEKEILTSRLHEVEKQIGDIDSLIMTLRPRLGLPELKHVRAKKDAGDNGVEKSQRQKYKTKKMKLTF